MQWVLRAEPTGNPLTDAHEDSFLRVTDLFHGQDPRDVETYRRRADWLTGRFAVEHRERLARALADHMDRLGADAESQRLALRLQDPQSVAVVTGQQAGLFSGPLLALYKALSAIGLAERLERELNRPVIPVFWVASEDHDWAEVDHAYILDDNDDVRRVRLDLDVPQGQMVHFTELSKEAVQRALDDVNQWLPEGPHKSEVLSFLMESGLDSRTMAEWFGKVLIKLLLPKRIVLVDPCLPALRQLVAPVWERALLSARDVQRALDSVYSDLGRRGFTPTVARDPEHTHLFFVEQGRRRVLELGGDGELRLRGSAEAAPAEQWVQRAQTDPAAFSANVLLRPVVQDVLLPTLAYVGGPAEISYHALAKAVFDSHGRELPPLLLRKRVRVVPASVRRAMEKWGLTFADVENPLLVEEIALQRLAQPDFDEAFRFLLADSEQRWRQWADRFSHLGPQISAMAAAQIRREAAGIERVEAKAKRLFAQVHDTEIRQLKHIDRWLWLDGHPQERRLSPLNVWARYGLEWLGELPFWGAFERPSGVYDILL